MKYVKLALTLGIFFSLAFLYSKQQKINGVINNVKDSLSSSQLSYFARTGVGTSATLNLVTIKTGGSHPSLTTSNLFVGDTLSIGRTGADTALDTFTVSDINSTAVFSTGATLTNVNGQTDVAIISTRSAIHSVYFTPGVGGLTGTGGTDSYFFELLLKMTSTVGTSKAMDGIPDQDGFDIGADYTGIGGTGIGARIKAADVVCPLPGGTVNIGLTLEYPTSSGNYYHRIICPYTGFNSAVGYSMIIGRALTTGSQISNPSRSYGATDGLATGSSNVYNYFVRHMNGLNSISDSRQGKIAVVESVRVTATIDPTITFQIGTSGVLSVGTTRCGVPLGSAAPNTTATAVSFGSVSIGAFNDLAQWLSVVTNAQNGYAVTMFANHQLQLIGSGITIPPTTCGAVPCTTVLEKVWNNTTYTGFGYSLENIVTNGVGATFTFANAGVGGTPNARPFPVGESNAVSIINNAATPAQAESYFVCYRLNPSTSQQAGTYENRITYTATATF